jgi:Zn-dependent protease
MFRLFGFDVKVQSGFVMFMVLIMFLYRSPFGLWLAGSIAVLTLVHELGHAVAARRTGAHAEISLGFLAGYASYRPTRKLSRAEQAWISFAGPFVQISVSVAVLVAMGVNPVEPSSASSSPAAAAIWWAGPAIGALNLIPVLPLDGGNIVTYGLDRLVPGRARRYMLYFSIAATLGAAAVLVGTGYRGFVLFIGFLLITQLQMLNAGKPQHAQRSVWEAAAEALQAGKQAKARRMLLAALSHPQPTAGVPDLALAPADASALIDLLPDPLPHGDPGNEYVLAHLLLTTRRYDEAAHYAAGSFSRYPNTLSAAIVSRAAAALGDQATAIGWLQTAADAGTSVAGLATTIDRAPELTEMRLHPDVVRIRRSLVPIT